MIKHVLWVLCTASKTSPEYFISKGHRRHVTRYFLTRESVSRYRRTLRRCMRNKILRSEKAKYHYILPFFFKINKGELPLMYSCVCFVCEFIDLADFSALLCDPCHSIHKRSQGRTAKQLAVRTLSTRMRFAARKPIESQIFSTRGKVLSSLHLS